MPVRHVIVDGSNLATEGRSMPSLEQLDQAVREFMAENPNDEVTVVVDASFGHRIDPSEVPTFDEAEAAGEVISPPAGAIGRGDAFLLRIAEKVGATVLSNDSFQEFHGDHPWLFDKGRLVGGKPVPGVGWIFMDRTPVRGQKSREVVKEAKRRKRVESGASGDGEAKGLDLASSRTKGRPKAVDRAIARATQEVVEPKTGGKRRRRGGEPPSEPVNEPLAFITFVAAHPLGSVVVGSVLEFSSHGVFVLADGARCYVPLSAMGEPPPRRAREVVAKGEERQFVVQAFDPQRRGIELAIPGYARVAGSPTAETVEAEIHEVRTEPKKSAKKDSSSKVRKAARASAGLPGGPAQPPGRVTTDAASEPDAASKQGTAGTASPAAAAAGAGTGAKKAAAKKAAAKKAPGVRASGQAAAGDKAAPVKKSASVRETAPVKKPASVRETAPGRETVPGKKAAPAKKASAQKVSAQKVSAQKAAPAEHLAQGGEVTPARRAGAAKAGPKAVAPGKAPAARVGASKTASETATSPPVGRAAEGAATAAGRKKAAPSGADPASPIEGIPVKKRASRQATKKQPAGAMEAATDGSAAASEPIL